MSTSCRQGTWYTPPYSLRTVILLAVSVAALFWAGLYSVISYNRLASKTLASAGRWTQSVAKLAGNSSANALARQDHAAALSAIQQLLVLQGIEDIALFHGDGRIWIHVRKTEEQLISEIGGTERISPPAAGAKTIAAHVTAHTYESWDVIEGSAETPLAWVRVQFNLDRRREALDGLWHEYLAGAALVVVLVLVSLHIILGWALRPIRALSQFAQTMSSHLGQQVDTASTCLEATQLATALNQVSRGMVQQIGRVQAIVNTAADAIIGLDVNGRVISSNPAATSIFGRPQEDLAGRPLEQCVPGLSIEQVREMFGDAPDLLGRPRRIVRHDFFGTRADGTLFPVEISLGEVLQNDELRYACIVRDVTDERAAQETSDLYERALAGSHNAVFITNARQESQPIVYINEAFQKITELPPHKILGRNLNLFQGDNPHDPGLLELDRALREQRNANVMLRQRRENGDALIAEVSLSPVLSAQGVLTHFVGIASDVTARVQAEQAMADRSAQLDAIFSLSPDGFVLFDTDERMVFANPAFERMTGIPWMSDSHQGMHLDEFEQTLNKLCAVGHGLPPRQIADDQMEPRQARLQLLRPQTRVLQTQSRRNMAGRRETILYFRDVTHEDEVDRMKSEFLASAAHELRTPMVSIFGFTELLLKRRFAAERQADMLQTIHRQSGLLVNMINELLDLARIESRRGLDLQIRAYPLRELVDNSIKGLMRQESDRQVGVDHVPDVLVLIDPEKIQLALNNLLGNAFKYSPQGGQVSLAGEIRTRDQKPYAVLEVQDQGIGMKPEQLERAFERFFRADTTGNIPGTGLGLSLVKEIADLHGGHIELASEFGVGTTARLWLPLPQETPAAGEAGAANIYSI